MMDTAASSQKIPPTGGRAVGSQRNGGHTMKFIENLANLIKVKTIVTLVVLFVFATLAMKGTIAPDNVMALVMSVVSFYFGTQLEKGA